MKMGDDLHHMDNIEANFVVNETEYLGSITFQEPHQQAIYSNLGEVAAKEFAENIDATILTKDFQKDKSKIY
jgi:hypothetical protein